MQSSPIRPRSASQRGMILMSAILYNGIIAVLIGLLLPAVQQARESGRALQQYEETRALGARIVAEADATADLAGLVHDTLISEDLSFRTLAPMIRDQVGRLEAVRDAIAREASFTSISNVMKLLERADRSVSALVGALHETENLLSHADEQRN